jgi:DHA2 family multidrug resistance protein
VLLWAGGIFTLGSIVLPFAPGLRSLLVLQVVTGLASGTFYPLSLSYALRFLPPRYIIYGIGAYSMELIGSLSIATPLQAWYAEHLSWRWMFWNNALLTPLMMLCIYLAVPPTPKREGPAPKVSWRGFLYASVGLSLIEGALEQGERLDWLGSGTIVGMLVGGGLLLVAAAVRRWWFPNPLVKLSFLWQRNTLLLGVGLFTLRFCLLTILVLIPGYLGAVQGYRPLETGRVLLWLAVPTLVIGVCAARVMKWVDGRLVAAVALALVATACLMDARLTSAWAADQFWWPQLVMACGLACLFVGQIGLIVQTAIDSGALTRPIDVMTFAAFFQTVRLLGGQIGASFMQRFISIRATFHSSTIARSVEAGNYLTDERLQALATGFYPGATGMEESQGRAAAALASEVSRQALTLTYMDGFLLVAWVCTGMMLLYACVKATKRYYDTKQVVMG